MPSRSPTRQITDCGIGLQTLPALPHHPQTQIEQVHYAAHIATPRMMEPRLSLKQLRS